MAQLAECPIFLSWKSLHPTTQEHNNVDQAEINLANIRINKDCPRTYKTKCILDNAETDQVQLDHAETASVMYAMYNQGLSYSYYTHFLYVLIFVYPLFYVNFFIHYIFYTHYFYTHYFYTHYFYTGIIFKLTFLYPIFLYSTFSLPYTCGGSLPNPTGPT